MEAMQEQTVDVIRRMKEISTVMNIPLESLLSQGVTIEDLEGWNLNSLTSKIFFPVWRVIPYALSEMPAQFLSLEV